ncbi:MAG: histidinol-phosphate transaminase [Candidatus Marinimicrobia bacterium]|nr:histidinol-phosphate transaminase [Candidatus Neomarinimicrobiota bacterium]RPG04839.1 MAG: histidinol-phosphate transaminase [Pelagibacteraceae bacterium TMED247]|tara:strand:- start:4374 stop:5456 length:1083 start_codon:yes stop_codon:yes gene_type:complete
MKLPKPRKIIAEKYVAGLSLFKSIRSPIKLSANESALGPSPKAVKAYNSIGKGFVRYPDSDGTFFRKILAKKFHLERNRIILGSGSDQIFELACKLFLNKGDEVVVSQYSFIIYRIYSRMFGAKVRYAKEENFKPSVQSILDCVNRKTKIVFLANPNNPTGTYLDKYEMLKLRKKLRSDILLVVDDAYCEFINDSGFASGIQLFSKSKNVLVTRTFSKIYGLAGLRIGWGYSSKAIIEKMYEIKPPFNVSRPALFAATQAVQDTNWLQKAIKHNNFWSEKIFDLIDEIGVATNKTNVNFFLLNFDFVDKSSSQVFNRLANSGILVRQMNVYGIKNSLRVTIGNNYENKKFISTLRKIFNV